MVGNITNFDIPNGYCVKCGQRVSDNYQVCNDCGAVYCPSCAQQLKINNIESRCLCGSRNVSPTITDKLTILEKVIELKRQLKQILYRPVILMRRTGRIEDEFNNYRHQYLIPKDLLDQISFLTKKVEKNLLDEAIEYTEKITSYYQMVLDKQLSDHVLKKIDDRLELLKESLNGFDNIVKKRLEPINKLVLTGEDLCNRFSEMNDYLEKILNIFVLIPGELGIGTFKGLIRKQKKHKTVRVNIIVSTDRITFVTKERQKLLKSQEMVIDEILPEDLLDITKSISPKKKSASLHISCISGNIELIGTIKTINDLNDCLRIAIHGRPQQYYKPKLSLERDWSSEEYQEKVLHLLQLARPKETSPTINSHNIRPDQNRNPKNFNNKDINSTIDVPFQLANDTTSYPQQVPVFVNSLVKERIRKLRQERFAIEKTIKELKEGNKRLNYRDYFELLQKYELKLSQIDDELNEAIAKSGLTNLFDDTGLY